MHFFDPENGIAIAAGAYIFKTADSGFTWTPATYPKAESGAGLLQFPSIRVGFGTEAHILEANDGCYFIPVIIKSTDEGDTWNVVTTLNYPSNDILSMNFVNDTTGHLVKTCGSGEGDFTGGYPNDGELLKTNDSGKTWQIVNNGLTPGIYILIISDGRTRGQQKLEIR